MSESEMDMVMQVLQSRVFKGLRFLQVPVSWKRDEERSERFGRLCGDLGIRVEYNASPVELCWPDLYASGEYWEFVKKVEEILKEEERGGLKRLTVA